MSTLLQVTTAPGLFRQDTHSGAGGAWYVQTKAKSARVEKGKKGQRVWVRMQFHIRDKTSIIKKKEKKKKKRDKYSFTSHPLITNNSQKQETPLF